MKKCIAGGLLGLTLAAQAGAGQVAYKVTTNGQSTTTVVDITQAGQTVVVALGTVEAAVDVHFYDIVTGDGVDDVGAIEITGSNTQGFPIRVAVADAGLASVEGAFLDPAGSIDPGLRNLGGIQFSNAQLRDSARLNVCVRGDITGDIAAGQLFRIQALRDETNTYGGTISGNLTATSPDRDLSNEVLLIEPAIGQVWAGWEISGVVSAWGAPPFVRTNRETWGSVDRIVVDSGIENAAIPGLTGNLNLPLGFIREIVCAGPIGRGPEANLRSTITAGVRIGRITIRQAESVGDDEVLAYPIYADIEASATGTVDPAFSRLSSLTLIETEDDFVGSLHLVNFSGATGEVQRTSLRRGIFVGGDFVGSITVDYCYEYGDMIARSFRGPIWIGQLLKGAIVAVGTGGSDPLDGTIDSVEVGYGTIEGSPLPDNGMGFCATIGNLPLPPFENSSRDNWYTLLASDFSTVDSVIRADRSIGTVRLKAMSERIHSTQKFGKARVEAPLIGSLAVDSFDSGSIWSGRLLSENSEMPFDMSDNYVACDILSIGCMGPKADLWVQDCPLLSIKGDLFGEIHLPRLNAGETIMIDGRFGDLQAAAAGEGLCQAAGGNMQFPGYELVPAIESSPRSVWPEVEGEFAVGASGVAPFGRIILEEPSSLNGQIIIDATNSTGAHRPDRWTGDIVIGSGTPLTPGVPVVLSTSPIRAQYPTATGPQPESALAPLYSIPSSVLAGTASGTRGGAVGLVPFARYEADCNPENYRYFEETNHSNAPFLNEDNFVAGAIAAEVAYYGPVFSAGKGLELNRVNRFNSTVLGPVGDTLYTTDAANGNRAKPRVVAVTGNNEVLLGGRFALLPRGTASPTDDLLCDLGPGIAPPLTFEPADSATRFARYDFLLAEPCSQTQCSQCFGDMGFPLNQFCFIADHNNDDGVDGDDVIAFFTDWEASNQNADVNFDNGVDGDDIIVFFCWWDAGGCNAN